MENIKQEAIAVLTKLDQTAAYSQLKTPSQ